MAAALLAVPVKPCRSGGRSSAVRTKVVCLDCRHSCYLPTVVPWLVRVLVEAAEVGHVCVGTSALGSVS